MRLTPRLRLAALLLVVFASAPLARQLRVADPTDATPKALAVVQQLTDQKFADIVAQFQPAVAASLSESQLRASWLAVLDTAGAFKQAVGTRSQQRDGLRGVIVTCQFERGLVDIHVTFDASDRVAGLAIRPAAGDYTPPPYAVASAYSESEVTVGSGEWALPGTLILPTGPGPFPAVVLVHGSGPNDRDESIGPNKLFKDLALGLGSLGVATLRYEKRTRQYGPQVAAVSTLTVKEEVVDDALAAVAVLRATPKIDRARIFVLGHSLGGMLIPRIGAADPALRGLIAMAGATSSIDQALVEQTRHLAEVDGTVTPAEQQQIDSMERVAAAIRSLTPAQAGGPERYSGAPASYWLDLRGYDPPAAAKALKMPLLFLQGERDYQVPMTDFARWKTALGDRRNVTFRSYPGLNHIFQSGNGPGVPAEYLLAGHVPETVVRDIASWVRGQ